MLRLTTFLVALCAPLSFASIGCSDAERTATEPAPVEAVANNVPTPNEVPPPEPEGEEPGEQPGDEPVPPDTVTPPLPPPEQPPAPPQQPPSTTPPPETTELLIVRIPRDVIR